MKYIDYQLDIVDSRLIREDFAGTYIVESGGESALVEVSSNHTVPHILNRLEELNLSIHRVKYIFITHIHLDHASGVGSLMEKLPNAKLVLHPSGAKHMINPEKLIAGAIGVYGKEIVDRDYGEMKAVPEERVIQCSDGESFTIGNRVLQTLHTPGHARHHISIFDTLTKGIFTGDSYGLSYPEMSSEKGRFLQPTTTPTAFEYEKMKASIDKMMALNPSKLFLTHYGIFEDINFAHTQIVKRLDDYIALVSNLNLTGKELVSKLEEALSEYYVKEGRDHNSPLTDGEIRELFSIDIALNAMGLALWYDRKRGL